MQAEPETAQMMKHQTGFLKKDKNTKELVEKVSSMIQELND